MADVNRLRIVRRLAHGEATVAELIAHVGLSQPLVSWHLGRLRAAGVVETRRRGRETICRLREEAFTEFAARERAILGVDRLTPMTISNESRGRIKKIFEPIALGMGRVGPDTRRADAHRLRDHRGRCRARWPPSCGSSAGSSSSSAVSSTCSTARSPGRPARSARSARSWTRSSTAGARRSSTSAIAWGGVLAGSDPVAILAVGGPRCGVHGQLHAGQVRRPRLHAGTGMAAVGVMPREIRLVILSLGLVLAGATANLTILAAALAIIAIGADHHGHPADPPRPQPGQVGRHHPATSKGARSNRREQATARTARTGRRPATPGPEPAVARTARSGSPSSASATARAASSRAATTTRTPRRTTSSRA